MEQQSGVDKSNILLDPNLTQENFIVLKDIKSLGNLSFLIGESFLTKQRDNIYPSDRMSLKKLIYLNNNNEQISSNKESLDPNLRLEKEFEVEYRLSARGLPVVNFKASLYDSDFSFNGLFLANSQGGFIYLIINDNGQCYDVDEKNKEELENIQKIFAPQINIIVNDFEKLGKELLAQEFHINTCS